MSNRFVIGLLNLMKQELCYNQNTRNVQSSEKDAKCLTPPGVGSAKKSVTCRRLQFGPRNATLHNELYKQLTLCGCRIQPRQHSQTLVYANVKVKQSRYRPGVAQRVPGS